MYFAFIDESESPKDSQQPQRFGFDTFFVGCLLANSAQAAEIDCGFADILTSAHTRHGVPRDAEFHGHCMFQYTEDWECLKGKHGVAIGIYKAIMKVIVDSGARLFIRGIQEEQLKRRYGIWAHDPHQLALQYCLERVNYYAESNDIDKFKVMADRVSDPAAQEGVMKRYQLLGATEGYVSSDLARIRFPFMWEDSKSLSGLQAIDTALFITARAARIDKNKPLSKSDKAVMKVFQVLKPCLHPSSGISYLEDRKSYSLF
ncbi:MAG: DUF3800 domain-containing protein [Bifidobacterium psychraerophilum]|uniref:DUF3800 domain-containing protein n=1 Tax=Bifidobacterium psychraerophilum TaxID=218140 RepID=UPI0039E7849A